jgi:SAM-dependent methyltransferase
MTALATWLWLLDFRSTARALDASESPGDLAAELKEHFSVVDVLRSDRPALERVRARAESDGWAPHSLTLGSLRSAPWPAETFDCIALHDALVERRGGAVDAFDELVRLRLMLKPDGWLAVASANPNQVVTKRVGARGIPRARLTRLLTRARFREVRCLFVATPLEWPVTLVPDSTCAIDAHIAFSATRGTTAWAKRTAARLGLRSALFPGYFLLARA